MASGVELALKFSVAFVFVFGIPSISTERLNDFVSHFEPLNYDRSQLEHNHRVRRSLDEGSTLHLDFSAHGRQFKLRLKRDTAIFAPDLEVDSEFDPAKVYNGHVDGHPKSYVHGFVHDGIFEGKVKLSDKLEDEYHIEPSSDHFPEPRKKEFHSVIYKASHLHYPYSYGRDLDLSDKTKEWMRKARELADDHYSVPKTAARSVPHRYRRATADDKVICQIHLRADHLFTKDRAKGSKERALLLMTKHVQAAHDIYRNTIFRINGKEKQGFGFAIKRMGANSSEDTVSSKRNPYADAYIGVEKFLDIISLEKTENDKARRFCLSHVFTYRDFEDGVLGLAWVGEPAGQAAGGICEVSRRFSDGRQKTLNTGVVTFINYNKEVPSRVSEVTFAHELGHNFGAKHDSGDCGENSGGNFIMFPKATSGTDENNRKFSRCSVGYISPVIETKGPECFQTTNASICGNRVVEPGEECDCGFKEDCDESCCYDASEGGKGCELEPDAECSPSQGLCCDQSCRFSNSSKLCNEDECVNKTYCTGSSRHCPEPTAKDNLTDCDDGRRVCLSGECSGSRCLSFGKKECQCSETAQQCLLCCLDSKTRVCSPLNETGKPPMKLLPGAPCNNFQGYCDVFDKCRGVDSEGPLERIKNLLFGGDTIENLVDWIKTYWWAAILIGLGLILLMAGFIKVCSVATPSSNPNKPKARTLSLRRGHRSNPGYVGEPPPAYDIEMGRRERRGRNAR